jgi:hypothetical protein
MNDAAQRYQSQLAIDVFERMSFKADPRSAAHRAGLTALETQSLMAQPRSPSSLPDGWSACVVCSDPGPDDFPGYPTDEDPPRP